MPISFIIPTCGRPRQLEFCLEQLRALPLDPGSEILVVEDGPLGLSEKVVNLFHRRAPFSVRFLKLNGSRQNPSRARNYGALMSRGDKLFFLDDDILLTASCLTSHLRTLEGSTSCLSMGLCRHIPYPLWSAVGSVEEVFRQESIPSAKKSMKDTPQARSQPWLVASAAHLLVDRDVFLSGGLFDERFEGWGFEDTEFAYRLSKCNVGVQIEWEADALHLDQPGVDQQSGLHISEGNWDPYQRNAERFMQKYPEDAGLRQLILHDIANRRSARGNPPPRPSNAHLSFMVKYEASDELLLTQTSAKKAAAQKAGLGEKTLALLGKLPRPLRLGTTYVFFFLLVCGFLVWFVASGRARRLFHR